jgi:transposase-like protein
LAQNHRIAGPPAEHWIHLRTTNPIESTFATVWHRTNRARGFLSRDTLLAFTYKPTMCAQARWHWVRGSNQLEKLITGVKFKGGIEVPASSRYAA